MKTRKILILFVFASLAGHALLLALTVHVGWQVAAPRGKVLTVALKAPADLAPREEPPLRAVPATRLPAPLAAGREDSVALQGRGGRYDTYLLDVRRRIERIWRYPPQALAAKLEGDAEIRFTIDAAGALAGCSVTASSGNPLLDEEAMAVVRTAAPYNPLPGEFQIARLNITATFSYQMGP
jgi:protein TonB